MIDVADITVTYEDMVLDDVSFTVDPGTVALLTGPNGAGKTSMLRVIAGRMKPAAGRVRVDGVDVWGAETDAREVLAFLPQDVRFHEALTPRRVLRFYAGLRGRSDPPIDALLGDVGLGDAADRPCGALSGGMRQRLGLAVVQLSNVPVLLLDEPGRSLDRTWREYLRDRLQERADAGASVLLATHHPEGWQNIATKHLQCADASIDAHEPDAAPVSDPIARSKTKL
ncbi:ABC transporter ATP-binding protein [Longibacter sp.]|jgi:heme ABC exporter ATP-binding subunit CcmA|uniref:ABC transporter ATP-binding protein n=1 Tax=Longibacter sp. TaxID=2045415 RepID=UPI003EBC6361